MVELIENEPSKKIRKFLKDENYFPNDEKFRNSLPDYKFQKKLINRAKYMLESIEEKMNGGTSEKTITSLSEVHLEHIIPQTIHTKKAKKEHGDWEEYLGSNSKILHKRNVDKIGNMTLLGEILNKKASNNPFKSKVDNYKKSNILLTKNLGKLKDFKIKHLESRSKELTEYAVKIWNI